MANQNKAAAQVVSCNKCKGSFAISLKYERQPNTDIEVGYACPHCGLWYHCYTTSPALELLKRQIEEALRVYHKFLALAQGDLGRKGYVSPQRRAQVEKRLERYQALREQHKEAHEALNRPVREKVGQIGAVVGATGAVGPGRRL